MSKIEFRKVKAEEINQLSARYTERYPWAAEPNWESVWVLSIDGYIKGFFGTQQRMVVEPLFSEGPETTRSLIDRIDAMMAIAGVKEYEFVVPDANERFQSALEKHYGLKGETEIPHKIYFRRF